jgi:predicted ABC-type sugar transport system permease subunit
MTKIAPVVKGGGGTILGLIVGDLIIGVLNNAMQPAGRHDFYQNVVEGVALLAQEHRVLKPVCLGVWMI